MDVYGKQTRAELIETIRNLTVKMDKMCSSDVCAISHDLEVHRVELEARSQELRDMHHRFELSLERYADLYDFAPIGYLTLNHAGKILEINLTGARLLGQERIRILGRSFTIWLSQESMPVYKNHMQRVCHSVDNVTDEFVIKVGNDQMIEVSMSSVANHTSGDVSADGSTEACRSVLIDITERKQSEYNMQRSRALLRELSTHHEAVREEERKRVAREIHDELGQSLLALKMDVSMLSSAMSDASPVVKEKTKDMLELINRTIKSVRDISSNLRPAVLDLGLVPALEWLLDEFRNHTDMQCTLNAHEDEIQVSDDVAIGVFRIVQESLTNVVRHAHATIIDITLQRNNGKLFVKIQDNGIGIDVGGRLTKKKSFGLTGIGERISMMGGVFSIESKPGAGTALIATLPFAKEETES